MPQPDDGVIPASPAGNANDGQPNGSEPVNNAGGQQEQFVPYSRFKEVNDALKESNANHESLAQEFETFKGRFTPASDQDDDIDPDVQRTLDSYAKKHGFVSQADLEKIQNDAKLREQVQTDIGELSRTLKDFDYIKVRDYANENGYSLNSKSDMKAVYNEMNHDAILEAATNAAIADYKKNGGQGEDRGSSGTRPNGSQNDQQPSLKGRIAAARAKLKST